MKDRKRHKDTEQRKLMENQMAQADKLASIGQLSAGIAHEMNNPLGIILGYTQLLLRDENSETERYKDLKTIEKHVKSCKAIVEDLLSFARSSKPEREVINIQEAIDDVLSFVVQHSDFEKVEVIKDYDINIPPVLINERKLKQVFMNLIMNAKHAVGKTRTIKITTKFNRSENRAYIMVIDTGYGIGKKNLSRIFDPFFTTKPTGEGTGLGLSVSYGIIKNYEGEILVESRRGKGSTFTVVLPVKTRRKVTN
jgi:signal transduction histidine kinase